MSVCLSEEMVELVHCIDPTEDGTLLLLGRSELCIESPELKETHSEVLISEDSHEVLSVDPSRGVIGEIVLITQPGVKSFLRESSDLFWLVCTSLFVIVVTNWNHGHYSVYLLIDSSLFKTNY